jgi:hypothetical protein
MTKDEATRNRHEELIKMRDRVARMPANDLALIESARRTPEIHLNSPDAIEHPTTNTAANSAEQTNTNALSIQTEPKDTGSSSLAMREKTAKQLEPPQSTDQTIEAAYNEIERAVRLRRHRREDSGRRVSITVTADVFSAVTHLSRQRGLKKIEIVNYLLSIHLPSDQSEVPAWLLKTELEASNKEFNLTFFEDSAIGRALFRLANDYELYTVEIVETIILRYLPKAPQPLRPRRRLTVVRKRIPPHDPDRSTDKRRSSRPTVWKN